MAESQALREAILERLSGVIDPETGADVVRMRLIEDLAVDDVHVSYNFRTVKYRGSDRQRCLAYLRGSKYEQNWVNPCADDPVRNKKGLSIA